MSTPNELHPELLSLHALFFSAAHNSAPRLVMASSHIGQRPPIKKPSEQRIQTGVGPEMAKYTFSIKVPTDARIIEAVSKYPRGNDIDSIPYNPEVLVVYEDDRTKEIGCLELPEYCSHHSYFGFKYNYKPASAKLSPGTYLEKGTILADSPAVTDIGSWQFGKELNIAYMTHPATAEDGIAICEDVLDDLTVKVYETRWIEFGTTTYPINLYGDAENYKPFPECGEYIHESGALMVLREYDPMLAPVQMSIHDLCEQDCIFDIPTYVRGPGGRVIDIEVYQDADTETMPLEFSRLIHKYSKGLKRFYNRLLEIEREIGDDRYRKFHDRSVIFTPEMQRYLVKARAVLSENDKTQYKDPKLGKRLIKEYRKTKVDAYRIKFVVEYDIKPTIGFKKTGTAGNRS